MNDQNNINNNGNGFQDPTVTPVQPDAAVSADNAAPVQPVNQPNTETENEQPTVDTANEPVPEPTAPQPPVPTPPTYEQYAAQQAAAQQARQNSQQPYQTYQPQNGANPQYNGQYNPQQPYQQPPVYQNFQPNVQPVAQNNGVATASLIVGIVSLVCCGFPAGIVAVILGIIGLNKSKTMCGNGKGMAIAGIILGAVSIVFSIAMPICGYAIFRTTQIDYDNPTDFYSMVRMFLPF